MSHLGAPSQQPVQRVRDELALRIRSLSKAFAGQLALDCVDLDVRAGEVHAILGTNGSGKSTLIKVLAGYHEAEAGSSVQVNGAPLELASPKASGEAGLRFIHQDLGLIGTLSAAENLALGGTYSGRWWLSDRRERQDARRTLEAYGVRADPALPVDALRPTQRTLLAIARAVERGLGSGGVLVLDEPTASLPPEEVRHLFAILDSLRARGVTIVYVTHRLTEVFTIADRVSVLRDGRHVATEAVRELDHERLLELILGRRLELAEHHDYLTDSSTPLLEVTGLCGDGVERAAFSVRSGEILGITGLMGSGYDEVLGLLFGAQPRERGDITVGGERMQRRHQPAAAIRAGLAYAPAERRRYGAIPEWTLRENLTLPKLEGQGVLRWLSDRREATGARPWLERLDVRPANPDQSFATLSGGNQQRLVLARWLRCGARVFLLDEPTLGVDAGAKQAIYAELRRAAVAGAGVVISSSDTEEICTVSDRILVMGQGVVRKELTRQVTPDELFAEILAASSAESPAEHLGATRNSHQNGRAHHERLQSRRA